MSQRIKRITRRIKRFLGSKVEEEQPKKLSASWVMEPEKIGAEPESRPEPPPESAETTIGELTVSALPGGVTHISFNFDYSTLSAPTRLGYDTISIRDPITRRLSRRQVTGEIQRTTSYYDARGRLISDQ